MQIHVGTAMPAIHTEGWPVPLSDTACSLARFLHHYWPIAGRMVPKTLTTKRTTRPKNCSPSAWLRSLAIQAVGPSGSSVRLLVRDGTIQNLLETARPSI